jgi:CRP-like cAMP-binding protein
MSNKTPFDAQAFLDSAGVSKNVVEFRRKATVFAQGDPAKTVMYIQQGGVKLSVVNGIGKEAVVAVLGPGDFLGEGCLAGQPMRMGTATAIRPTTLLIIEKHEMIRVLRGEHQFSDRFISYMLARNIRIEADLIDQLFNSTEKRLARGSAACSIWQGRSTAKGSSEGVTRDAGGNDWHNALASESFHEQIQEDGFHRVQQRTPNQ